MQWLTVVAIVGWSVGAAVAVTAMYHLIQFRDIVTEDLGRLFRGSSDQSSHIVRLELRIADLEKESKPWALVREAAAAVSKEEVQTLRAAWEASHRGTKRGAEATVLPADQPERPSAPDIDLFAPCSPLDPRLMFMTPNQIRASENLPPLPPADPLLTEPLDPSPPEPLPAEAPDPSAGSDSESYSSGVDYSAGSDYSSSSDSSYDSGGCDSGGECGGCDAGGGGE
jgi:hypothetical protein